MPDRHPLVAGKFYSNNQVQLQQTVKTLLDATSGTLEPLALMLPHAGYQFCGSIIGQTLGTSKLPSTLVLLGPNHSGRGKALAVWPEGKWHSPLGALEVDADFAASCLAAKVGFEADLDAHASEHSLEVLLPFLQLHCPGVRIVPVCVALNDLDALRRAGQGLARCISEEQQAGRKVAIIISSDMNHFDNQEMTVQKDTLALAPLLELEAEKFFSCVRTNRISMCGVCPATLALFATKMLGAKHAELVAYGTSASTTNDTRRVVGYAGVRIY